jgi:hypothetical protein
VSIISKQVIEQVADLMSRWPIIQLAPALVLKMKIFLKTNSVYRIQKSYAKFAVLQLESIFITEPEHASVVEVFSEDQFKTITINFSAAPMLIARHSEPKLRSSLGKFEKVHEAIIGNLFC